MADAPATRAGASAPIRWFDALRAGLGRPPLWLVIWAVEVLLALGPALMLHGWLTGALGHHYEPGSLLGNLGPYFRFDHRQEIERLDEATGSVGAALAILAILFGTFSAGGWLQVFLERTEGHSLRRFFLGGARYFWRFLRLTVLTVLALAFLSWVVHGPAWKTIVLKGLCRVPANDVDRLETFTSEWTAFYVRGAQQGVYAIAVGLLLVWGDYTRTRLALHDTASAVWAGICTVFTMLRHPVKTLRPFAALFALEAALLVGAGMLARAVEGAVANGSGFAGVGILLTLAQIALMWRIVLRGARYHAAIHVSREVVRPISRPDPWRQSVGPEGGPRYPIGGDEYGMSL